MHLGLPNIPWDALHLPLLLAVILAAILSISVRRRRRIVTGRGDEGPWCAKCGYSTVGLPSSICPECGSDLHAVGTHKAGDVRLASRRLRVAVWTAFLLLTGLWGFQVIPGIERRDSRYHVDARLSAPKSAGYSDVRITGAIVSPMSDTDTSLRLAIRTPKGTSKLDVEVTYPHTARYDRGLFRKPELLTKDVLLRWMKDSGAQGDGDALAAEAGALMDFVVGCREYGGHTHDGDYWGEFAGRAWVHGWFGVVNHRGFGAVGDVGEDRSSLNWLDRAALTVLAGAWLIGVLRIRRQRGTPPAAYAAAGAGQSLTELRRAA